MNRHYAMILFLVLSGLKENEVLDSFGLHRENLEHLKTTSELVKMYGTETKMFVWDIERVK